MKTLVTILSLFQLAACQSNSADSSAIPGVTQTPDTAIVQIYTLEINNQQYIQATKDGRFNCLLSVEGDTIVQSREYYFKALVTDIDEDGFNDIRVLVNSNTPNQCENYLFDKTGNTFKLVENCDLDIRKIKGTTFYYSYNRAGCNDMNWESYLSKIENYRLVDYGFINGRGCNFEIEENPQVIEIYKVNVSDSEPAKILKTLPYHHFIKKNDDKWDFVENYWKKNYKIFER
jgi:hypothetical protein